MLKTKSIQSPKSPDDGLRILAARFRGRGVPTTAYDVWMPSLGPSEELLRDVLAERITWAAFVRAYKAEMQSASEVDARCKTIKNNGQRYTLRLLAQLAKTGNVTLMCHCDEDAEQCHRYELQKLIAKA